MLIIFITYLTMSQMAMVLHLNIEEKEKKNLIKNLVWGLIFLNLKEKYNLMSLLIGSKS